MKPLNELRDKSHLALTQKELIELAKSFSPTEAYSRAVALYYSEELARSCRFVAIIRRDYGIDGLNKSIRLAEAAVADMRLKNQIAKGIGFLEVMGGGKLMIIHPEDRELSLVEYLAQSRADSFDLGLSLGEYTISLKCQFRPVERDNHNYELHQKLKVTGPNGVVMATEGSDGDQLVEEQGCRTYYGDSKRPSSEEMRNRLYDALVSNLLGGWSQESAADLIIKDLEKRDHTVAPRFWKACEEKGIKLWQLTEYGLIDKLEEIAQEVREKAVRDGVNPQALGYLDFEVYEAMTEAILQDARYAKSISLLEKLRQPKDRLRFAVEHHMVPGAKASKTYNFLVYARWGVSPDVINILEEKGYGGSVVMSFFNIPSGMAIARTGQCNAFILDYQGDSEEKLRILEDAQKAMEEAGHARGESNVPKIPTHMLNSRCSYFAKFLDNHFPLC